MHVAKHGTDSPGCGTTNQSACHSLQHSINISQSGDILQITTGSESWDVIYEHCATQGPITKSLTIIGTGSETPILHCGNKTYFEGRETPLLFHFENATLKLKNLKFESSHVLGSNIDLDIVGCVSDDSVLFLMEPRRFVFYLDQRVMNVDALDIELMGGYIFLTTWADEYWGEEKHTMFKPLTCLNVTVTLQDVTWLPQRNEKPVQIDVAKQLGLQIVCQNVTLTVRSSTIADNPVFLFSVTQMNVFIHDSTFEGSGFGSVTQGGLQVNSFSFPKMIIENCIFSPLKYNDVAFAQISALKGYPAALSISVKQFDFSDLFPTLNIQTVRYYDIMILRCLFISCVFRVRRI